MNSNSSNTASGITTPDCLCSRVFECTLWSEMWSLENSESGNSTSSNSLLSRLSSKTFVIGIILRVWICDSLVRPNLSAPCARVQTGPNSTLSLFFSEKLQSPVKKKNKTKKRKKNQWRCPWGESQVDISTSPMCVFGCARFSLFECVCMFDFWILFFFEHFFLFVDVPAV